MTETTETTTPPASPPARQPRKVHKKKFVIQVPYLDLDADNKPIPGVWMDLKVDGEITNTAQSIAYATANNWRGRHRFMTVNRDIDIAVEQVPKVTFTDT